MDFNQLKETVAKYSVDEKKNLLQILRQEALLHPFEQKLNTTSDIILEALNRASDLTQRGIRGIIAELEFKQSVLDQLKGWNYVEFTGDQPYDFKITDGSAPVTIQVKLQRSKEHLPLTANNHRKSWSADKYIVEIQKTRNGKDADGADTRPYRFGEFDIIAVSMYASTKSWKQFVYTVGNWLTPRKADSSLIAIHQQVSLTDDEFWTKDILKCIERLRSGNQKTIEY